MGLLGGVIAPFIVSLANDMSINIVGVFGVIGLGSFFIICALDETLNMPIRD
jgi:hypothetical protein